MADESERDASDRRLGFVVEHGKGVLDFTAVGQGSEFDLSAFQNSHALLNFVVFGNASGISGSLSQDPTAAARYLLKTSEMRRSTELMAATEAINGAYVLENREEVAQFIRQNRLRHMLEQAVSPLNESFGREAIKSLKLVTDDEGSQTLFCLIMVTGSLESARNSLESFDRNWWLGKSRVVAGKLNFDYELV